MSNSLFPSVPGLQWDIKKTPQFAVIVQTPANLKNEVRIAVTNQPQYQFELNYEFLRNDPNRGLVELDTIEGFFKSRGGNFDSFLLDISDLTQVTTDHYTAAAPLSQNGDGVTTQFELCRTAGGFREVVDATDAGTFQLFVDGVLQVGGYTLNAPYGWVTFSGAPANGKVLTWTGFYYYRVRFRESMYEFNLWQQHFWELQTLTMLQVTT